MGMLKTWANQKDTRPFTGSVLKWAALVTMSADHLGAVLIETFLLGDSGSNAINILSGLADGLALADDVLRIVGRMSFPLFCFLIAEGAVHTGDSLKYLKRLYIFALVSEIPFDLAIGNQVFYFGRQNVFFTLAAGLAVIIIYQRCIGKEWKAFLMLALAMVIAEALRFDYGAVGPAVIFVMYYFHDRPAAASALSYVFLLLMGWREAFCFPAFLLMALYNGKRGRQPKAFFYWYYPAHLVVLWFCGACLLPALIS